MSLAERFRAAPPRRGLHVAGVPPEDLRAALALAGAGVNVVTTGDLRGRPFATTATTVSSVSLRPPLILTCLREESQTLAALLARRRFAINVLHRSRSELPGRVADLAGEHSFDAVADRGAGEIPLLHGAIATLECDLHDVADAGDHSVVIGHVTRIHHPEDDGGEPLPLSAGLDPHPS